MLKDKIIREINKGIKEANKKLKGRIRFLPVMTIEIRRRDG